MEALINFVQAVASHWLTLMSGAVALILYIFVRYRHRDVSHRVYLFIAFACIIVASFLAWRDQYLIALEMKRRLDTDPLQRELIDLRTKFTLLESKTPASVAITPTTQPPVSIAVVPFIDLDMQADTRDNCLQAAIQNRMEENLDIEDLRHIEPWKKLAAGQIKKQRRSLIEAAHRRGIQKLIGGVYYIAGPLTVTAPLELLSSIIDLPDYNPETSFLAVSPDLVEDGSLENFFLIVGRLSLQILQLLHVNPTAQEMQDILATGQNWTYENYCLRLVPPRKPGTIPPLGTIGPKSRTQAPHASRNSWQGIAQAVEIGGPEEQSRVGVEVEALQKQPLIDTVQRYTQAYMKAYEDTKKGDERLTDLEPFYDDFSVELREALLQYFRNAADLRLQIKDIEVLDITNETAVVAFTRIDTFADQRRGGLHQHMRTRLTTSFLKIDGNWKIAAAQ